MQALKFGAQLSAPCGVTAVDVDTGVIRLALTDGTSLESRPELTATTTLPDIALDEGIMQLMQDRCKSAVHRLKFVRTDA